MKGYAAVSMSPEPNPREVLYHQNALAYLRGFIPRPKGEREPTDARERKRRIARHAAWLAVRGY